MFRKVEDIGLKEKINLASLSGTWLPPVGTDFIDRSTGSGKRRLSMALSMNWTIQESNSSQLKTRLNYQIEGINQVQGQYHKLGLDLCSRPLRSVLAQDPNIIMVGEIKR